MRLMTISAVLIGLLLALVAMVGLYPAPNKPPPRPAPTTRLSATLEIAPTAEALTFARFGEGATAKTLAVKSYQDGSVSGVDLTSLMQPGEDAIALYNRLGYDRISAFVAEASTAVSHDAATLAVPVDLRNVHAAVATNYPEHANEAKVKDGPFMFAKVAQPTASRAAIPAIDGLLDYEVELCLVTLTPLKAADGAKGGLILCNDVTDRAALMRGADVRNVSSGDGFTDGKSGAGFLPVGDLFVVPRDLKAFVAPLDLQLSVNGEPRQRTRVTQWIWDLDRLVLETAKRQGVRWTWRQGSAQLPVSVDGIIADRTLILAGTPAGTIFKGPSLATYVRGAGDWILGFGKGGLIKRIVERAITDDKASGAFLMPGDVVSIRVGRLGSLDNRVE
jgi:2-keto-4-pentenoate hydratase/2-oxohepta-3-ene-1,7-dioic acid hydratase in catechol pathway